MKKNSVWQNSIIKVIVILACCFLFVGHARAEDIDNLQEAQGEQSEAVNSENATPADNNGNITNVIPAPEKNENMNNVIPAPEEGANMNNMAREEEEANIQKQSVQEPVIFVDNVNSAKGTFQVHVRDIQDSKNIKKIEFAVWSDVGGQDDLAWYNADSDKNGGYVKTINISSHKYSLGRYQIHVYVTDLAGKRSCVGGTQQKIDIQKGQFSIKAGKDEYTYAAELKDTIVPGGIGEVQFAVWSNVAGQDDIRWYIVNKATDGAYRMNVSLKNHKGFGNYNIHAYVKTKGGNLVFIDGKLFATKEQPKAGSVKVEKYDEQKGTFQIVVSDLKNAELVKEIQIPVWSASGGQDDIKWYQAKKNSKGQYVVIVDIRNHKYTMGQYTGHIYIRDNTDYFYCAAGVNHSVKMKKGTLTVTQAAGNKRQYTIELKGFSIPGGVNSVQFPVWSETGGQDDIRWYTANRKIDGTYQFKMSIENHKGLGKYSVHAYVKMPDGTMNYISAASFQTEAPKIGTVKLTSENRGKGQFQVKITDIVNSELIQKIQVPIWSEQNQGDIVWYTATKNKDGSYVVNADISNHKYNPGVYKAHVYFTDATGVMQFGGKAVNCNLQMKYTSLAAVDTDKTERTYRITLKGLDVPVGEKGVSFAVWGDPSGQNDIRWYTGTKNADGSYSYIMNIQNHKELGKYNVHAYYTTKANTQICIGGTSFSVKKTPAAMVSTSNVNGTNGSFTVTVSGVTAPSGIARVQIPVWCAGDQSDIRWYDAIKVKEGVYTANVSVANHGHHFGNYKIHVYVTMGNGIMVNTCGTNRNIQASNYVYSARISSTQYEVGIMGATGSRVQFATWSDEYGQDDLKWYEGYNCGNGKWNVLVDSLNHNSAGGYTTHVYVTDSRGSRCVGGTSYSLDRIPPAQAEMMNRANWYSSSTPYLILVNRSTHLVGVFQGWQGNWNLIKFWDCADGKPSTPTVEGEFTVGSRGYYFNSGAYRCYWWTQFYNDYLFHSVLYNWGGVLQDGRLGMGLSHGCVRLQIDNAKWIYDNIPSGTKVVVYH